MTKPDTSDMQRVVTGFPIAPIIFPFLWLFVDTSKASTRVRIGTPVIFPFLWLIVDIDS